MADEAVLTEEEMAHLRERTANELGVTTSRLLATLDAVQERARIAWREHEKVVELLAERTRERNEAKQKLASFSGHMLSSLRNIPHADLDTMYDAAAQERRAEAAERECAALRAEVASPAHLVRAAADELQALRSECAALRDAPIVHVSTSEDGELYLFFGPHDGPRVTISIEDPGGDEPYQVGMIRRDLSRTRPNQHVPIDSPREAAEHIKVAIRDALTPRPPVKEE
jgi:hypothetical protein